MIRKLIALPLVAVLLALAGIALVAAPASAHTPAASASCSGVKASMTSAPGDFWSDVELYIDGTKVYDEDHRGNFSITENVVPQDYTQHTWRVKITNNGYGLDKSGTVGPCKTKPTQPPADTAHEERQSCDGVEGRDGVREYVWNGTAWVPEPYDNIAWGAWTHVRDLTDAETIQLGCTPPPCDDECAIPAWPTNAPPVTRCTGVLSHQVLNSVVVPKGQSCTLVDTWINGSVRSDRGRNLTLADATVRGNIVVTRMTGDFTYGAKGNACRYDPMVGGSVVVKGSHNVLICQLAACKDVRLEGNDGRITLRSSSFRRAYILHNSRFVSDGHAGHARASIIRLIDNQGAYTIKGNQPRKVQRR